MRISILSRNANLYSPLRLREAALAVGLNVAGKIIEFVEKNVASGSTKDRIGA